MRLIALRRKYRHIIGYRVVSDHFSVVDGNDLLSFHLFVKKRIFIFLLLVDRRIEILFHKESTFIIYRLSLTASFSPYLLESNCTYIDSIDGINM